MSRTQAIAGGLTGSVLMLAAIWFGLGGRRPVHRVVSASMAPTWLGPHLHVVCDDCMWPFAWCGDKSSPVGVPTCPNCGHVNDAGPAKVLGGDAISVIPWTGNERPERWGSVVYQSAADPAKLELKRIVGLPGENIAIYAGDVFVDGECPQRSLAQFREMAILVYDDSHRSQQPDRPLRWRMTRSESRWQVLPAALRYEASAATGENQPLDVMAQTDNIDWINYQHFDCSPDAGQRWSESPIDDYLAYNQPANSRLHYVQDLMIRCRVTVLGDGWVACRIHHGEAYVQAQIAPGSGTITMWTREEEAASGQPVTAEWAGALDRSLLEMVVVDGQAMVAIDREVVVSTRLLDSRKTEHFVSQPVSFAANGSTVQLEAIQILRDIYYLDPGGANQPWSLPRSLGHEEYFLLGDNSAISIDSRQRFEDWPVHRKLLQGKALKLKH